MVLLVALSVLNLLITKFPVRVPNNSYSYGCINILKMYLNNFHSVN